jgi:hypothetical protein
MYKLDDHRHILELLSDILGVSQVYPIILGV